jgi:hypothetical protein
MSAEIIKIKVPINKSYFSTFMNSFIPIYFMNDNRVTLETLKNLLFPVDYSDNDFNDLVAFVGLLCNEVIKTSKEITTIKSELSQKVRTNLIL